MNQETLYELACGRISDLVDQLHTLQSRGDVVSMAVVNSELRDLTAALDSEDASDNFFYAVDYKHLA